MFGLLGGGLGALTNPKRPLLGALIGGGTGALGGGLLGGAAGGAGSAATNPTLTLGQAGATGATTAGGNAASLLAANPAYMGGAGGAMMGGGPLTGGALTPQMIAQAAPAGMQAGAGSAMPFSKIGNIMGAMNGISKLAALMELKRRGRI